MRLPCFFLVVGCAGSKAPPTHPSGDSGRAPVADTCNRHAALCDRPVSTVTFPGTHNSMSNAEAGWIAPNQQYGLTRQLEDGIRGLMLDTHAWDGDLWLCPASCELGALPLADGLEEIRVFLDAHPQEVIQIIFQDAIPIEDTRRSLDEAGLGTALYTWDPSADPTLQDLIDREQNLIVGLESGRSDDVGIHAAWDLWMDTPYSFWDPSEFSCELNRGQTENPLFLVNHWLSDPLPSPSNGQEVNVAEVLEARARTCAETWDRPINFLGVDFYDQGALIAVTDRLNGVEATP